MISPFQNRKRIPTNALYHGESPDSNSLILRSYLSVFQILTDLHEDFAQPVFSHLGSTTGTGTVAPKIVVVVVSLHQLRIAGGQQLSGHLGRGEFGSFNIQHNIIGDLTPVLG